MRRTVVITAVACFALASVAAADTGTGRYAPHGFNALEPNAPPLSTFGDDVVRVRAYPSLGGGTWMVELHTLLDGSAEGEAVFFDRRSMREEWRRSGSIRLLVGKEDWAEVIRRVDVLLAQRQAPPPPPKPRTDGMMEVCVTADGTGQQIERRRLGRDAWMTSEFAPACGGRDPSEAVAALIFTAAARHVCRAMNGSPPCDERALFGMMFPVARPASAP